MLVRVIHLRLTLKIVHGLLRELAGQFRGSPEAPTIPHRPKVEAVGEAGLDTPLQGEGTNRIGQTKE